MLSKKIADHVISMSKRLTLQTPAHLHKLVKSRNEKTLKCRRTISEFYTREHFTALTTKESNLYNVGVFFYFRTQKLYCITEHILSITKYCFK